VALQTKHAVLCYPSFTADNDTASYPIGRTIYATNRGSPTSFKEPVTVDTGDTFLVDTNVALVAQPTQNQLRAYSAVTGTWASLGVAVDAGDAFKVGGNTQ
jgi:hypothetical protein